MSDVRVISWREAGDISKAVKSSLAKAILEELSEGKQTATQLAKTLDHPLNTITYHLDNLGSAGIIKATHVSYSKKGKEVAHYSLVSTPVVITSGSLGKELLKVLGALVVPIVALPFIVQQYMMDKALPETLAMESDMIAMRAVPAQEAVAQAASPYPMIMWFIVLFLVSYILIILISYMIQMKHSFKKS